MEQSMFCFGSDSSDNDNSGGDESQEVQERYDEQQSGSQPLPDPNSSQGYSRGKETFDYLTGQANLANNVAQGNTNYFSPTAQDTQAFAREQNAFDNLTGHSPNAPSVNESYDDFIGRTQDRAKNSDELIMNPDYVIGSSVFDMGLGLIPQGSTAKRIEGFLRGVSPLLSQFVPNYEDRQMQSARDIISGKGSANFDDDGIIRGVNYYDRPDDSGDNNSSEIVAPMRNPMTNQNVCPEGYRYDDTLQACRLDTASPNLTNTANPFPAGEAYYRANTLDKAPINIPSGFDYNSANDQFINSYAYRPANFTNQMGLNGFTPFKSS